MAGQLEEKSGREAMEMERGEHPPTQKYEGEGGEQGGGGKAKELKNEAPWGGRCVKLQAGES